MPTLTESIRNGGVCSTVDNIACHVLGLIPPGTEAFRGGTGNWHYLARQIGEPFEGPGTMLEPGDILISPFTDPRLAFQGHTGMVFRRGIPRNALIYHWWTKGGLRRDQSVADVNYMLSGPSKWTHVIRFKRWKNYLKGA